MSCTDYYFHFITNINNNVFSQYHFIKNNNVSNKNFVHIHVWKNFFIGNDSINDINNYIDNSIDDSIDSLILNIDYTPTDEIKRIIKNIITSFKNIQNVYLHLAASFFSNNSEMFNFFEILPKTVKSIMYNEEYLQNCNQVFNIYNFPNLELIILNCDEFNSLFLQTYQNYMLSNIKIELRSFSFDTLQNFSLLQNFFCKELHIQISLKKSFHLLEFLCNHHVNSKIIIGGPCEHVNPPIFPTTLDNVICKKKHDESFHHDLKNKNTLSYLIYKILYLKNLDFQIFSISKKNSRINPLYHYFSNHNFIHSKILHTMSIILF